MLYRAGLFALFLFEVTFAGVAQQPANAAVGGSDGNLVLDVVVTDKSGKPVPGLQEQDFTVLDNGKPTGILSFHAQNGAAAPTSASSGAEIILVLDEVNAPYEKAWLARDGVKRFLTRNNGELAHPVSLALFTDSGLQVQTSPSMDGKAMAAALGQQQQGLRNVGRVGTGVYEAEDRVRLSLDALNSLVAQAQAKPGRKMVIWVSPGWPLLSGLRTLTDGQMQHIYDNVVRLSGELRQARMTLYSVDPLSASGVEIGQQATYYQNFTKALMKPGKAELGDMGLQVLAVQTGGQAIYGNNSIADSLDRCAADLNASYVLSIAPAPAERATEYHSIEVKLGTPGLKARTRNGYYAQP